MINEAEGSHTKPQLIETICISCKRKQVFQQGPDQPDAPDVSHKRPKLEATLEPVDDDDDSSSVAQCSEITSAEEHKENEGGQSHASGDDKPRESAEHELQRLRKEWTSPIYAFFKSSPAINHVGSRRVHVFECLAENCKAKGKTPRFVNRYLDKADARSTSNLRKHVKICWGPDIVAAVDKVKDLDAIRTVIGKTMLKDGSLAEALEGMGKGKLTYILSLPTKNTEST